MHHPRQPGLHLRSGAVRPRVVLLCTLVFMVLGTLLFWVSPWLLPVSIVEGPLVQQATEDGVTLVWFTSRPAECAVAIDADQGPHVFPVQSAGCRHCAQISELSPGHAYPYRIHVDQRNLAEATFYTNKPAGEPFSFIVFGDSGMASAEQYLLAADMARVPADFVLHTGDLVYGRGERSKYRKRFFLPYRQIICQVAFWPSLGNHDVSKPDFGAPYIGVFQLPENGPADLPPERNYWFDYASARIAIIDSNIDLPGLRDAVAPWLEEVMASEEPRWKFAVLHHPPYTGGAYEPDERIQQALVPTFEMASLDMVFVGHDHMYQRTYPILVDQVVPPGRGVVYIVTGAGGARLYDAKPPGERPTYVAALHNEIHSFTHVAIDGDMLSLRQIALGGDVLDTWEYHKEPAPAAETP
ncbi:MAG: metallophosphoesterase [Planctomycetes bacterium]|nr:metallophosphoesterase [Planctomycetota bacterium]